uniref:DUF3822 family protein n=1 Tax=Panagrolaimus davidi TaxID=227884 RepID=A0A914QQN7_9BILA
MFTALKEYTNEKRLIGFLTNEGNYNVFSFVIIDSITEKFVKKFLYKSEYSKLFMDELLTAANENLFKVIFVDLFELQFKEEQFGNSYKFCKDLKQKFNELKIPSYFFSEERYIFSSFLIAAKIEINFDETVLTILPCKNSSQKSGKFFGLIVAELKFTPNGYVLIKHEILRFLNSKENPEILFQKICGSSTPQKIIASTINCKAAFKKIFKSKNVTFLNEGAHIYYERFIVETAKWFFDKSFIKYYILPISSRNIRIYGYYGTANNILDIINIKLNDPLPFKKIVHYSKSIPQLHVSML